MALNFQQVILKLHDYWADYGCVIWEPYNVQVGAGTANPATTMRVLGPEPWRIAYVEPSVRPDDGRYGENPNRMQRFYQYQVILKPDPGNPQEIYLKSLEALGINPREHDIRFVEDNWESPALGAWGLGWEVWLDGQEITQFTYFQQAAGQTVDPIAVEITYGIERIVLALQDKDSVWDIEWLGDVTYRDMIFNEEVEHSRYYFDVADVDALKRVYDTYEHEVGRALEGDATISAYDYVLKCSHLFNVLDTRGAIGVTERAKFFRRMRDMTRSVAQSYLEKREALGYPFMKMMDKWGAPLPQFKPQIPKAPEAEADFLFEIGVEELPASDVDEALRQLKILVPQMFEDLRLTVSRLHLFATPRRLVVHAEKVMPRQTDEEFVAKGPPARVAFDADGNPTKAAIGFAKRNGIDVSELKRETIDGGEYVTAIVHNIGQSATQVLQAALPKLLANIKFKKTMRWNSDGIAFSRPLRWLVALYGDIVIPFQYAGVIAGNITRGLRPYGSPEITAEDPDNYISAMAEQNIFLNRDERRETILGQITGLAEKVGGTIPDDSDLLDEVTNLIEAPMAFMGNFDEKYLQLPRDVLITVMKKHQRYFPVLDDAGNLMAHFIGVRNGDMEHLDKVIKGNEHVIWARFSDADYFYRQDIKKPLDQYLPRLDTLIFHDKLGSMLEKNNRVAGLVADIGEKLGMTSDDIAIAKEAAAIAKADLATQMVVEMTSLQGAMGREYALKQGKSEAVANAIFEHWQPRSANDSIPNSQAGIILAVTDKLDSLVGLFAAGLAPKSTSDPFGLRRAALGIVQILVGAKIEVNVRDLVRQVTKAQAIQLDRNTFDQLMDFIKGRLDVWLDERSTAPRDVINAVLAEQSHNPYRAHQGIEQLQQWVNKDNWETILDNFARCVRISRGEKMTYTVNPDLFEDEKEKTLYEALQDAQSKINAGNVDAFLTAFEPVVPVIFDYFETVMVNAEDEKIRQNRLGMMQAISHLQKGRANLSELTDF
ncbi:MAG: glycine--tRNA ligase subunit beta [Anaerolineae bacterium]|nr:glycine--tRNA ligase subunit beta [Anaerolineae bacterium]MDQ7037270.1 glycine--tRNA ligase subunit beta [Anaerolineae bacterium]